ncbi:hypothetical protein ABZ766_25405 [Streptomyces sp. NPDC006670]|uniref:hypothetical protein n=1 Tax=Streptomyces sp. NPDC006670 TaxID=3154476 RepID=UPI0033D16CE1
MAVEKYRSGRARPDGVLAPVGTFAGTGEWADPTGVLMVLEVTSPSTSSSTATPGR